MFMKFSIPKSVLVLICVIAGTGYAFAQDSTGTNTAEGIWQGSVEFSGMKLRIVFKITRTPEGGWKTTIDSPDQGAKDIPVTETSVMNDSLKLRAHSIMASFDGKNAGDWNAVRGEWKQGGVELPLVLNRTESAPKIRRPQEPEPPYPYLSEEVTFSNPPAGIELAATFTRPEGQGPFPAVVLVSGSGPQDRDEFVFGHRPFLVLADALARRGIAVLRYDDRGIGKSTGNFSLATTEDFASDARSAVEYLWSRRDVKPLGIGLLGHSEGALIAPLVASRLDSVAFLVLLAGPGMKGEDLLVLQGQAIARAEKTDEAAIALNTSLQKSLFAVMREEPDPVQAQAKMRAILMDRIKTMSEAERKQTGMNEAMVDMQVRQLTSPWFRYFLSHDPVPALEKTKCPVLALWGEKDLQVPPVENLPLVENALKRGGNGRVSVRVLKDLNHLFQTCTTGSVSEYGTIEETLSPGVLKAIGDWILGLK
jgi:pimeloyl-ACP methyl ester carboxylesterase